MRPLCYEEWGSHRITAAGDTGSFFEERLREPGLWGSMIRDRVSLSAPVPRERRAYGTEVRQGLPRQQRSSLPTSPVPPASVPATSPTRTRQTLPPSASSSGRLASSCQSPRSRRETRPRPRPVSPGWSAHREATATEGIVSKTPVHRHGAGDRASDEIRDGPNVRHLLIGGNPHLPIFIAQRCRPSGPIRNTFCTP